MGRRPALLLSARCHAGIAVRSGFDHLAGVADDERSERGAADHEQLEGWNIAPKWPPASVYPPNTEPTTNM